MQTNREPMINGKRGARKGYEARGYTTRPVANASAYKDLVIESFTDDSMSGSEGETYRIMENGNGWKDFWAETKVLPHMLNDDPKYEDWYAYVSAMIDTIWNSPKDNHAAGSSKRREVIEAGKTGILRSRQARECRIRKLKCEEQVPFFNHCGDSDYDSFTEL